MNKLAEHKRDALAELPKAKIEPSRLSWALWLIPLGAIALCGWFVYRDVISKGPTVTIYFENADGLEEQNTQLRYRGAMIGQVKGLALTKDTKRVAVKAQLVGSARGLARGGSTWWIVRPEVKIGSVSGLRTIISGEYIAVQPGTGEATNTFTGAEKEPITEQPGSLQFTLLASHVGSVQELSPVFYRGIQVGEVLHYQLGENAKQIVIRARIRREYAPLLRQDSRFWNAGGFDVHAGLFKGVEIQAESPRTIFGGGIEFATPTESKGAAATEGATFLLNEKPQDEWKTWSPNIPLQLPEEAPATNAPPPSLPQIGK